MKPSRKQPPAILLIDRLPQILRYPLQNEAMVTIALLAVLRVLVSYVPGMGGLLNVLIGVAVLRYAAEVLSHSANGSQEAPNGVAVPDAVGWTVLRVLGALMLATLAAVVVLAESHAGNWAYVPLLVLVLALPASLISAAIDQDPWGALNPLLWWRTILRIGPAYLVAAFLCVLIAFGESYATRLAIPLLPSALDRLVAYCFAHYATVATFHLLGVMVYEYRDALGFDVVAPPAPLARPNDRDQLVLDSADGLARKGDKLAAARLLGEHIRDKGGSDAVHQRYRKLLIETGDSATLTQHARNYLNVLIANERWGEALDFWAECRKSDPGLWPSDAGQVLELVEHAHRLGRGELSLLYANGMHIAHPRHEAVAPTYLLVARAMAEKHQQITEARNLLEATLAAYPKTKKRADIEAYLMRLA